MAKLLENNLSFDQIKELLDGGEPINQNNNGFNALHAVVFMTHDIKRKIKLLVDAGVDVNAKGRGRNFENTPLHFLIANEFHESALFLISQASTKIDYSVTDLQDKTTLILAAKVNSTRVGLTLLKEIGNQIVILNRQDEKGMSALHYACLYGNHVLANALIGSGASLELLNSDGKTPLDCLALGEDKIKQVLNSIEIDPERDEKALYNCFNDKLSVPFYLVRESAPLMEISIPARKSNIPSMLEALKKPLLDSELFRSRGLLGVEDKDIIRKQLKLLTGISLSSSMSASAIKLKQSLLEQGFYSSWLLRNESAAGNLASVSLLLKARTDKINDFGLPSKRTALHQAAIKGHLEICLLLLKNGALVNCKDHQEETPLHLVILNKHVDVARLLVIHGADLSSKNKNKKNPLALIEPENNSLKHELIALHKEYKGKEIQPEETLQIHMP